MQQSFSISPAPLTVDANDASVVYGDTPVLTGSLSGFIGSDTAQSAGVTGAADCSLASETPTDAGVYPDVISCTQGTLSLTDPDYSISSTTGASGTLTITQAPQEINFFGATKGTGRLIGDVGGQFTLWLPTGGDSGNPVVFTVDPPSSAVCSLQQSKQSTGAMKDSTPPTVVVFNAAGTCTVDVNQAGDQDYSAADQVQFTWTVLKPQSISFAPGPSAAVYGGSYVPAATASSGLPVTFSIDAGSDQGVCSLSPDGTTVSFTGAGTCVVDAHQAGDGVSWDAAPAAQQSFVIAAAPLTVNANNVTVPYGQKPPLSATLSGFIGSDTASSAVVSGSATCSLPAKQTTLPGVYTGVITCTAGTLAVGDANYVISTAPGAAGTLTITALPQTVTFTSTPPSPAVVGGSYRPAATGGASGNAVTFTIDAASHAGACSISSGKVSFTGVGTCIVDASQKAATGYAPGFAQQPIMVGATPTVAGVTPAAGPKAGASVTVTGTNFTSDATVMFGTTAATSVSNVSATQLTAVAPAHATGTVDVRVTTGSGGESAAVAADKFTYDPVPTVTAVSPDAGAVTGGTTITVTGTGFVTSGTSVAVGGIPATGVSVISSTQLTALVPAGQAGAVDTTVTTPGGTSTTSSKDLYGYGAPVVGSFTPTTGNTGGTVTIVGTGFVPAVSVSFGSLAASKVTFSSSTKITAVVPNGAVSAPVSVADAAGTGTSSAVFTPKLSIAGLSQTSGTPGTTVILTGVGFNASSIVSFNGTAAAPPTGVTPTSLTVTVPSGATTGPVTLTNTKAPTGTVQAAAVFTVNGAA